MALGLPHGALTDSRSARRLCVCVCQAPLRQYAKQLAARAAQRAAARSADTVHVGRKGRRGGDEEEDGEDDEEGVGSEDAEQQEHSDEDEEVEDDGDDDDDDEEGEEEEEVHAALTKGKLGKSAGALMARVCVVWRLRHVGCFAALTGLSRVPD